MSFRQLQAKLADLGVDTRSPGFYDSRAFLRVERSDPAFLQIYNEFVVSIPYESAYLERSRRRTELLAAFLGRELRRDGRVGACVDASGVAMRILEREGIWCCMFKGGLRIVYPGDSQLPTQYFYPVMHPDNPAVAGHAWLCVPPFAVVDLTLSLQPRLRAEHVALLPPAVMAEGIRTAPQVGLEELAEPELLELIASETRRRPRLTDIVSPEMNRHFAAFPPQEISIGDIALTYYSVAVTAAQEPLEQMRNLVLSGRTPLELADAFMRDHPPN